MPVSSDLNPVGFLGGTFDPVHNGHLRVALEFADFFKLSEIYLLPCHQPAHRQAPSVSAEQRKEMLELAVAEAEPLHVDMREMNRSGPSYTVDTLAEVRKEVGMKKPLYFAMGSDAFNTITSWKEWQKLFELANIVVMHRPGVQLNLQNKFLRKRLKLFPVDQSAGYATSGNLYELTVSALDISSTQIRALIKQKKSLKFLLPIVVEGYIKQQQLYQ